MDKKKRNILLIVAAIFIGSYVARPLITSYLRTIAEHHKPPPPPPKPPTPKDPLAAEAAALGNQSGFWRGHAYLQGRGMCNLGLELRQKEPGHYTAYSRFACLTIDPSNPIATMERRSLHDTEPEATILTGLVQKGGIRLQADKNVGDYCPITDLTITPFGTNTVTAEWEEKHPCQGGKLLLVKEAQ